MASVQAQTEQNIEHIIVIDGATDNSAAVAWDGAKQDPRIHVRERRINRGLAYSQNDGIREASSPWVLKVDADDKIAPTYVEEILKAAEQDATRNVIFSPCQHFGARTDVYRYPAFNPARMVDQFTVPGPAAFQKALWATVGGMDETLRFAEDWDFYIRAQLAVGLVPHQLERPLWHYRIHNGPRASAQGVANLPNLQRYWRGHTRESVLAGSRSWGQWCAEQKVAA
jgi:glycosyltransferase involved in cell wall biosynthesis